MNIVTKCIYLLLLCSFLSMLGCAPTSHADEEAASVSISQEEFIGGIAKPILELMNAIANFYDKNATPPPSLATLQDFAKKQQSVLRCAKYKGLAGIRLTSGDRDKIPSHLAWLAGGGRAGHDVLEAETK